MTVPPDTLSLTETARRLNREPDWFTRNWPRLVKEQGFPPPFMSRPYAWDAAHVNAWIDRALPAPLKEMVIRLRGGSPDTVKQTTKIDAAKARLDQRFARTA